MSNNNELKPCPFCGGEAKFGYFNSKWYVKCEKCDMELPHLYYEKEEATSKWNNRADSNYSVFPNSSKLTYADVEKMVKPLEWRDCSSRGWQCEVANVGGILFTRDYLRGKRKGDVKLKISAIANVFNSDIEAYKAAQKRLVDLVAAALGVERSGE